MAEERIDSVTVETGWLSPVDIDSLGESVLAHALQRLEAEVNGRRSGASTPIAAFSDSV
jgi:hypothetical protein